jgi:hypothetical protein
MVKIDAVAPVRFILKGVGALISTELELVAALDQSGKRLCIKAEAQYRANSTLPVCSPHT